MGRPRRCTLKAELLMFIRRLRGPELNGSRCLPGVRTMRGKEKLARLWPLPYWTLSILGVRL